jgi:hypothetical protein
MDSSSTDHNKLPCDRIVTLPKIFNFEEGMIGDADKISNLNSGEFSSAMDNVITTSHLRLSSGFNREIPLIIIWKTSLRRGDEEALAVTATREWDKVRLEKIREGQSAW